MKKLILATVLAGLSTAAAANVLVNNGYYVQADLGYSNLEAKYNDNRPNDNKLEDKGLGYGISFGKDTNYGKINSSYTYQPQTNTNTSITSSGELKAQSLGLSAIYDFDTVSGFTPYAGARVGINQIKSTVSTVTTTTSAQSTTHSQKQENKVGFGVLAGAQYVINPQLNVDAGVEYNYLGKYDKLDTDSKLKAHQYGAKVGLRYNF